MAWTTKELQRFSKHVRRCITHNGGHAALLTPGLYMPNLTLNQFDKLRPFLDGIPFCHVLALTNNAGEGGKRKIDVLLFAYDAHALWQQVQEWSLDGQKNAAADEDSDPDKSDFIEFMAVIRKQAREAIEAHFKVTLTNNAGH